MWRKAIAGVKDIASRESLLVPPSADAPERLVHFLTGMVVSDQDVPQALGEHLASTEVAVREFAVLLRWLRIEFTDGKGRGRASTFLT
jgi:hypothetical protein